MKRRWEVVAKDVNGREIAVQTFWTRRGAEALKAWQDRAAWGEHPFLTALTAKHGPLFTNEVRRV